MKQGMIEVRKIRDEVSLTPEQLDSNIYKHITKSVNNKNIKKCHKEYGYILNIKEDNVKVLDNELSRTDDKVIVTVEYEAETLFLHVGDEIDASINVIMSCGVFLNIHNVIDILITKDTLDTKQIIIYDEYLMSNDTKYIKGDSMKIRIIKSKYDKGKFLYIAEVV